uniref:LRRCT domain-containing protein n=1 Tax=Meloidogyne floridensis TaxID=298350 RepID=A0A915NH40_9BILA
MRNDIIERIDNTSGKKDYIFREIKKASIINKHLSGNKYKPSGIITRTLIFTLFLFQTNAQCPTLQSPCRCAPSIYEPIAIICEKAGSLENALRAAQPARHLSIDSLSILDTALPSLPSNAFYGWTILRLVLNRNTLSHVLDGAFNEFLSRETLLKLELRANHLTDQSFGTALQQNSEGTSVFSPLKNLQELSLETNQLTMIPSSALSVQKETLKNLNLGLNMIKDVPISALNFPQLSSLSLEFNGLSVIVPQAFQHDTIEPGAFQRTPIIQAIVLNKNRLTSDMFQGLQELYSLDLQGNRLEQVENKAFANLPALRHLDISYNLLQTLPMDTFEGTFEPTSDDRRVIYACENPWLCDSKLEWFRQMLRDNLDIDIDKPGCVAACGPSPTNCPPEGTPLRALDFCPSQEGTVEPMPLVGTALSLVGWIILVTIMTVLIISICLMALIRYGMSHRRKKIKDAEIEDEQRIMSSASAAASAYHGSTLPRNTYHPSTVYGSPAGIDLDLPPAHNLEERHHHYFL